MQELGRPEAGQHVAVKAVGRSVHLISFALRHAADSGVPHERLVELTGWEPELVLGDGYRPFCSGRASRGGRAGAAWFLSLA